MMKDRPPPSSGISRRSSEDATQATREVAGVIGLAVVEDDPEALGVNIRDSSSSSSPPPLARGVVVVIVGGGEDGLPSSSSSSSSAPTSHRPPPPQSAERSDIALCRLMRLRGEFGAVADPPPPPRCRSTIEGRSTQWNERLIRSNSRCMVRRSGVRRLASRAGPFRRAVCFSAAVY